MNKARKQALIEAVHRDPALLKAFQDGWDRTSVAAYLDEYSDRPSIVDDLACDLGVDLDKLPGCRRAELRLDGRRYLLDPVLCEVTQRQIGWETVPVDDEETPVHISFAVVDADGTQLIHGADELKLDLGNSEYRFG